MRPEGTRKRHSGFWAEGERQGEVAHSGHWEQFTVVGRQGQFEQMFGKEVGNEFHQPIY